MIKFFKSIKNKFTNADNVIDGIVDIGLLVFDVLSSPILLVMRLVRYYIKIWLKTFIKTFLKKTYHKIYDKSDAKEKEKRTKSNS